jgi:hypothetical protein
VQAAVLGWMQKPDATRRDLYGMLISVGGAMSAVGFEARFDERGAAFLREMVQVAARQVFEAETLTPVLGRFNGVYVTDSTRLEGRDGDGVKGAARLELQRGQLDLSLEDFQRHDNATDVAHLSLPRGALHLGDLGFFDLKRFAAFTQNGVEWVTRYKHGTRLYLPDGQRLPRHLLLATRQREVRLPVLVGAQRIPMLLVAQRTDGGTATQRRNKARHHAKRKHIPLSRSTLRFAGWTIYLTSLTDLDFAAIHLLYRARWQIERLFRRFKSLTRLECSRSRNPHRQACERYAKLLAALLLHWLTQALAWSCPRLSLDKAFIWLQATFPAAFVWSVPFESLLRFLHAHFPALSLSRRRTLLNTFDLMLAFP